MSQNFQPLSVMDLDKKLSKYGKYRVIVYKQLKHLESLFDVMPCILLYQTHYPIGHFVSLFVNKEGINYFDPTGRVPDQLLSESFDNPRGRDAVGADFTYLNQLLLEASQDSNKKVIFNEKQLQQEGTSSCGAWAFVRLLSSDVTNNQFNQMFDKIPENERERKIIAIYKKY